MVDRSRTVPRVLLPALLLSVALIGACGHGPGPATGTGTAASSPAAAARPAASAPSPAPGPHPERWIDLAAGECLSAAPPTDPGVVMVTVVDCATPHAAEVYQRAPVEVNAAVADVANRRCAEGLADYTGTPVDAGDYAMSYLIDSRQDRTSANPLPSTVICLLQAPDGAALTGSARGPR